MVTLGIPSDREDFMVFLFQNALSSDKDCITICIAAVVRLGILVIIAKVERAYI